MTQAIAGIVVGMYVAWSIGRIVRLESQRADAVRDNKVLLVALQERTAPAERIRRSAN